MDFAWVVDALRCGLRVTREAWRGDPPDKTIGQIMREYKTRLDSLGRPDENCANCEKHGWFEGKFVCRASKLVTQKSGFGDCCSEWEQEKDDGAWDPQ